MHRHQFLRHGSGTNQVQKKRLARAVLADDDPENRATLPNALYVPKHDLHLLHSTHLDQVLPGMWYYAGAQRLHDEVSILRPNHIHAVTFSIRSCAISIGSSPSAMRLSWASRAASFTRSSAPSSISSISAAM